MIRSAIKWLLMILLAFDLVFLNYQFYKIINTSRSISQPVVDCPLSCQAKIDQAIASIPTPTTKFAGSLTTIFPSQSIPKIQKTRIVSYLPISGNSQTTSNVWENLAGTEFNLNTNDYPNLTEAYFEANIKLINGNGLAFVRLLDTTAGIEVWGSEIQSSGQSFSVVTSGKLTIRPGNHLYRVQAKSLTADTTVFNYGRIKLVFEN